MMGFGGLESGLRWAGGRQAVGAAVGHANTDLSGRPGARSTKGLQPRLQDAYWVLGCMVYGSRLLQTSWDSDIFYYFMYCSSVIRNAVLMDDMPDDKLNEII